MKPSGLRKSPIGEFTPANVTESVVVIGDLNDFGSRAFRRPAHLSRLFRAGYPGPATPATRPRERPSLTRIRPRRQPAPARGADVAVATELSAPGSPGVELCY